MAPGTPGDQICSSSHCVSSAVLQSSYAGVFLSREPYLGKRKLKTLDALCTHRPHFICLRPGTVHVYLPLVLFQEMKKSSVGAETH